MGDWEKKVNIVSIVTRGPRTVSRILKKHLYIFSLGQTIGAPKNKVALNSKNSTTAIGTKLSPNPE